NWGILNFILNIKEDLSMNKFTFNDYFQEPEGKIAKRMLFKSDNVIAFVLNIAKGEILPGHTHLESTLFLQVMEGNAKVVTDGNETSLQVGELMQVDGQESLQVINTGDNVLRLYVTISPIGSEAFATDANV
ncbi:MAG: Cupin 2 conserved barrel domain protein, partial [Clostridiales bacterium]|nr:Cupin 2 conserved barrel domain protein [Clostridiales bacterium]